VPDNFTPGSTSAPVATDDIGGVHYQRFKIGYGPDGSYADATPETGLPTSSGYAEYSGTAAANNTDVIASIDVRPFTFGTLQLTGTWSAFMQVQGSNDSTNWVALQIAQPSSTSVSTSVSSNNLYFIPRVTRYLRVRTTSYSSGTVVATLQMFTGTGWNYSSIAGVSSFNVGINGNTPSADGSSGTLQGTLAAPALTYNGTNWDRVRAATAANGTTGTGVPAAGTLGFDGTNYRRLKTDTAGVQHTAPGYTESTGTIAANGTVAFAGVDVSAYRWAQISIAGTWVGTLRFQISADNATWFDGYAAQLDAPWNPPLDEATGNGLWGMPINARYFRVRSSAWTSGTATVTVGFSAAPSAQTWPQFTYSATGDTLADDSSGFADTKTGALGMVFDGTNWDRARSATAANGTSGTGLPGAAVLGWDGSVYRRLVADNSGRLQTRVAAASTSTVTSVTASVTSVTLLAANSTRSRVTVYNDSTADLYLKLGDVASATSFTIKVAGGGYYETPDPIWRGVIDGIWSAANGAARITELV
jgi:hypothetical protein